MEVLQGSVPRGLAYCFCWSYHNYVILSSSIIIVIITIINIIITIIIIIIHVFVIID